MLVFRIICAVLLAWAVNVALARSEAVPMLQEVPEMTTLAPIAAGLVGYFNLAVRQGWGFIVAFANGVWAGALAIIVSCVLYIVKVTVEAVQTNVVRTFDNFLNVFSDTVEPLFAQFLEPPLLVVLLGSTSVVGVVTEVLHWVLVRFRQRRSGPRSSL